MVIFYVFGEFWFWLRGQDLNLRPSGYEPDELPGCSTPRQAQTLGLRDYADVLRRRTVPEQRATLVVSCKGRTEAYTVHARHSLCSACSPERRKAAMGAALGYWPGALVFVLRRFRSLSRQILWICAYDIAFNRPGSDLLSRVLRRSTIGAGAFHGRVRNGNGCSRPAITTRSAKRNK